MMISSAASPSTSASDEVAVFARWCEAIGIPRFRATQFAAMRARDTYDNLLHYGTTQSPFRGAEFSVRSGVTGRVAFAPRDNDVIIGALARPTSGEQQRVADAAMAMGGVDFLFGYGENGTKLYVQRPHNSARDAFQKQAIEWLRICDDAIDDDDALEFVCVDFAPSGAMTAKIYRVTDDRERAREWLRESPLVKKLDDVPDAQFVVTMKRGERTLHARLFEDAMPMLDSELARMFTDVAACSDRRLVPTHLSWNERFEQTLYYMVDADV